MGEAKRRRESDPFFGKPNRGLVVSPPIEIDGGSVFVRSSQIDPQELRYALLFWDKLAWPSNNAIYMEPDADAQFLESIGILSRPAFRFNGMGSDIMLRTQVQAWRDLDAKEPGNWALSQGENSFLVRNQILTEGNGTSFTLHRAIPVPDKTVPLADILDFRAKRADELFTLRETIEAMAAQIVKAENQQEEFTKQVSILDRHCSDVLKVARELPFPIRLTNVKVSLDLKPNTAFGALLASYVDPIGMPMVSAAIVGAAASFRISGDFGLARRSQRIGPYRYVYSFAKELFP